MMISNSHNINRRVTADQIPDCGSTTGARCVENTTSCKLVAPISHHRVYQSDNATKAINTKPDPVAKMKGPSRDRYGAESIKVDNNSAVILSGDFPNAIITKKADMLANVEIVCIGVSVRIRSSKFLIRSDCYRINFFNQRPIHAPLNRKIVGDLRQIRVAVSN